MKLLAAALPHPHQSQLLLLLHFLDATCLRVAGLQDNCWQGEVASQPLSSLQQHEHVRASPHTCSVITRTLPERQHMTLRITSFELLSAWVPFAVVWLTSASVAENSRADLN